MEAYAVESGRVVIELTGLRGSLFGQTDSFFELLRWHIRTLWKILILVDEAHTAFGSVHSSETHQTEKRLAGNIIKMMSDKSLLGKVLWGLMTSRSDELDPDIKSRCPIQIPMFDLEGEERREFVSAMFDTKGIRLEGEELIQALAETRYYSARDYDNFVREVLTKRRKRSEVGVLEVLQGWNASMSIRSQREFQTLIALLHCTYPKLRPERLRDLTEEEVVRRIGSLRIALEVE